MVASSSAFMSTTCLPFAERLEDDVRAELDRAGDVDEHVDLLGAAEQRYGSSVTTGRARRGSRPRALVLR